MIIGTENLWSILSRYTVDSNIAAMLEIVAPTFISSNDVQLVIYGKNFRTTRDTKSFFVSQPIYSWAHFGKEW